MKINYVRGPQSIKSEDTFFIGYVLFDKKRGFAEVDVVEQAKKYLQDKIKSGEFVVPVGVSYTFEGSCKSQVRARKKMMVILPLALFGIASDNGVIMATYLDEQFSGNKLSSIQKIRETTILAGERRVRPALMTTATTILALIPVLTSVGRGADIMVPMAIPSFGGMTLSIITMLIVPVLYCAIKEFRCKAK